MNFLPLERVIFPEKFRAPTVTACFIKILRMLHIEAHAKNFFLSNLPDVFMRMRAENAIRGINEQRIWTIYLSIVSY